MDWYDSHSEQRVVDDRINASFDRLIGLVEAITGPGKDKAPFL